MNDDILHAFADKAFGPDGEVLRAFATQEGDAIFAAFMKELEAAPESILKSEIIARAKARRYHINSTRLFAQVRTVGKNFVVETLIFTHFLILFSFGYFSWHHYSKKLAYGIFWSNRVKSSPRSRNRLIRRMCIDWTSRNRLYGFSRTPLRHFLIN